MDKHQCPRDGKEKTEEACLKEKCSEWSSTFHLCALIFNIKTNKGDEEKERRAWEEIHHQPHPSKK